MVIFCPYLYNCSGVDDCLVKILSPLAFFDAVSSWFFSHLTASFVSSYCSDNCLNAPRTLKPLLPLHLHYSEYLIYSHNFKYHAWANSSQIIFFGLFFLWQSFLGTNTSSWHSGLRSRFLVAAPYWCGWFQFSVHGRLCSKLAFPKLLSLLHYSIES